MTRDRSEEKMTSSSTRWSITRSKAMRTPSRITVRGTSHQGVLDRWAPDLSGPSSTASSSRSTPAGTSTSWSSRSQTYSACPQPTPSSQGAACDQLPRRPREHRAHHYRVYAMRCVRRRFESECEVRGAQGSLGAGTGSTGLGGVERDRASRRRPARATRAGPAHRTVMTWATSSADATCYWIC